MVSRVRRAALAVALAATLVTVAAPIARAQTTVSGTVTADLNFTTPSKNIDCLLYDLDGEIVADCLVEQATWKNAPKQPADCDLDWIPTQAWVGSKKVGSAITNTNGVGACRGDIGPLCVANSCKTLAYGKSVTRGRITCTSATTGVTCVTTAGKRRGFIVNRSGYILLK